MVDYHAPYESSRNSMTDRSLQKNKVVWRLLHHKGGLLETPIVSLCSLELLFLVKKRHIASFSYGSHTVFCQFEITIEENAADFFQYYDLLYLTKVLQANHHSQFGPSELDLTNEP